MRRALWLTISGCLAALSVGMVWILPLSDSGQSQISVPEAEREYTRASRESSQEDKTERFSDSLTRPVTGSGAASVGSVSSAKDPQSTALQSRSRMNSPEEAHAFGEDEQKSTSEPKPFPISDVIERKCEELEGSEFDCAEIRLFLKTHAVEARDEQWAGAMESRLREVLDQIQDIRIRALECRSSICILECEGEMILPSKWDSIEGELQDVDSLRGYEGTQDNWTRVMLWVFKRAKPPVLLQP